MERRYMYEMSYNNSIFWGMVGRIVDVENERKLTIAKYYLVTHIHFYVK